MKGTAERDRLLPAVNGMAEVLAEMRSTMKEHVDCASNLVRQIEVAGRLMARSRIQARILEQTLAKTRKLKDSLHRQRALLGEVRTRLKTILAESAPPSQEGDD
jgi:hypothetical protein